ncbi:CHAT domain-containing protein [Nocardia sp. IFM 10818]
MDEDAQGETDGEAANEASAREWSDKAELLSNRYRDSGGRNDLDEAIDCARKAAAASHDEPADRVPYLSNLSHLLRTRFEHFGALSDLADAISVARSAVDALPIGYTEAATVWSSLGTALLRRAQHTAGAESDFAEGIEAMRAAARRSGPEPAEIARHRANLAIALTLRFQRFGRPDDLDEAIEAVREALSVIAQDDPRRPVMSSNLGAMLQIRFKRSGRNTDIDAAIDLQRAAVSAIPESAPVFLGHLANLGLALGIRHRARGGSADMTEARDIARRVVDLAGDDHADRPLYLSYLSVALQDDFEYTGRASALDESIAAARQAVSAVPEGHPRLAGYAGNLAVSLQLRFHSGRRLADLDDAIAAARCGVEVCAENDPDRPGHLTNLSKALRIRFERTGQKENLDESVELARAAVDRSPADRPSRAGYRTNLQIALLIRYERFGAASDLHEALKQARASVASTSADDPALTRRRSNLSNVLTAAYQCTRDPAEIEEAIEVGAQALAGVHADHPDYAEIVANLGIAFHTRFAVTGDLADARAAVEHSRAAAEAHTGATTVRLTAARRWARAAVDCSAGEDAHAGYRTAVELLPRVVLRGLPRVDSEHQLGEWTGLAAEAAAHAIAIGRPEAAVELLEQGRAVLWSRLLVDRGDLAELRRRREDLAVAVEAQLAVMETAWMDDTQRMRDASSVIARRETTIAAERRLGELLDEVRELPGLGDFLLPPRLPTLQRAARDGLVVMVNISEARCDALIVGADRITPVPLPGVTAGAVDERVEAYLAALMAFERAGESLAKVRNEIERREQEIAAGEFPASLARRNARANADYVRTRDDMENELQAVCAWLWERIAVPVCAAASLTGDPQALPRLWWCPTGKLNLLPLHAAGDYAAPGTARQTISSRVVPSYTPTLRALYEAASAPEATGDGARDLLIVSVPEPPDAPPLPAARDEAEAISAYFAGRFTQLSGRDATVESVLALLPKYPRVHFSCHGDQDLAAPFRGRLLLGDGAVTIADIGSMRSTGEFAFLAACKTATGGTVLADEVVTMAAALHYRGYRHIVGSLWSVLDDRSVELAIAVYRRLTVDGVFAPANSARALHAVIDEFRAREPNRLGAWLPFVHIGP